MSNRPDHLTDDLITQLLRTRSADPEIGLLDDIMRTVGATPQDRPWLGLRPIVLPRRALLLVALALLLATMGAIAVAAGLFRPDPTSVERILTIGDAVEAINARDVAALRLTFTADGILEFPGVDGRAGREGDVYRHDQPLSEDQPVEGWMSVLDTWGLEARLGSCRAQSESTISCAVRTRWDVLQMEIGEEWTFDFDGAHLRRLDMMARVDPDPPNRVLPLGLSDLQRWATWLRETHPGEADGLLITTPDVFAHYYFRFGASPDEMGASIREYIRAGLLGPDPVSVERMTAIRRQVDAINARDADAFIDSFIAEATFDPGGLIPYDPAFADEIEASIRDYLEEIQP